MMDMRRLGHSDIEVSSLSLGTVALGMAYGITPKDELAQGGAGGMRPPTLAEATRLIHRAIDGGINHIDTARGYGDAEQVLGHALKGKRSEVVLTTKASCFGPGGIVLQGEALRQQVEQSLTTSLGLLGTDHVDVLMLHSAPAEVFADGEAMDILKQFKSRGLTRLVGASTYGTEAPQLAIEQGAEVLQVAFNLLDQTLVDEVLPLAAAQGVGMVIRSVYLKGALTPRGEDLPAHLAPLKAQARAIAAYGAGLEPPVELAELALRFVLSHPLLSTALIGVRNEAELDIALAAANQPPLAPEVMARLAAFRWDSPLLNPGVWELP